MNYFIFKDGALIMLSHVLIVTKPYEDNSFRVIFEGGLAYGFPIEEMGLFTQALMNFRESI